MTKIAIHFENILVVASQSPFKSVNVSGATYTSVTGRILTSDKMQNYNSFENPVKIKPATFSGANLNGSTLKVKIPPFSVVVLELK